MRALVLGVNGQDGSYLAEVLFGRGYTVTGVGLQPRSRWVGEDRIHYRQIDVADPGSLDNVLTEVMPLEIYVMAAVHGPAGYSYEEGWHTALALNVGSVHTCLEHIRRHNQNARLFYPSSVKAFGDAPPACVDENSPRVSNCLYSLTKNTATELIHYYRRKHEVWASVGYYFNHDSPRRPDNYFLPRLACYIASQLKTCVSRPEIATLDFWCDWGSSFEFMEMTADLLQNNQPDDVLFATGQPVYAASLASQLAAATGLPSRVSSLQPGLPPFRADIARLRRAVGRVPRNHAVDVVGWILREKHGIVVPMADTP